MKWPPDPPEILTLEMDNYTLVVSLDNYHPDKVRLDVFPWKGAQAAQVVVHMSAQEATRIALSLLRHAAVLEPKP